MSLESFLRHQSNIFGTDVFVLLETLPDLPRDESIKRFNKTGDSWSDQNWAIIAYDPKSFRSPFVVSGGPFLQTTNSEFLLAEIELLQDLSLQSWSNKPDIDFLARQVAGTLVFFARARDANVNETVQDLKVQANAERHAQESRNILFTGLLVASLFSLVIGGIICRKIYMSQRKMLFPETRWPQRLGAPYSGGSSVKYHFEPPAQ